MNCCRLKKRQRAYCVEQRNGEYELPDLSAVTDASAETDLMDEFGLRKACQWAGNSPATAMKNYALVRKTDFVDAW